MFYRYRWCHSLLNGLALLLTASSVVLSALRENSLVVVGLTALGTIVTGWTELKKFSFKVDLCRFAYTTYEKTLIELKRYIRGLPLDDFEGFLVKMQTLNDGITDFTLPVYDRCAREYSNHFCHIPVDSPTGKHKLTVTDV